MTLGSVTLPPPQRWAKPFDPSMGRADVQRVLALPPFDRFDRERFPASTPLEGILENDARLLRLEPGDIIVRKDDYGSSAFFTLSGQARVVVDRDFPGSLLGRKEIRRKGLYAALAQLWRNPCRPEERDPEQYLGHEQIGSRGAGDPQNERPFFRDVADLMQHYRTEPIPQGGMFGEISALGRTPRTATVFAETPTELLEIRWQGVRDMRTHSDEFRRNIDALYRERSLKQHLRSTSLFSHLGVEDLEQVAERTLFESYGDYDWHTSYRRDREGSHAERLQSEPLIAREGHYVDGLILIRAGFCRVSVEMDHGHYTLRYLGAGEVFGLEEIAHNWRSGTEHCSLQASLRAIGYADILRVPTDVVERYLLANLPEQDLPPPIQDLDAAKPYALRPEEGRIEQDMLEFLVENRFINGTQAMLIDMDRCTRCDDCVRACALGHDNNPRFVRHGPVFDHYMVANACMHCSDPVCMIGCPTGAIFRDQNEGQVMINDITCIGCATCANSCPYNNIRMVPINDLGGTQVLNQKTFSPILKATKCDLCADQLSGLGPACARACPHDAMQRVDMRDLGSLAQWLNR